jgi:hypothetical protein
MLKYNQDRTKVNQFLQALANCNKNLELDLECLLQTLDFLQKLYKTGAFHSATNNFKFQIAKYKGKKVLNLLNQAARAAGVKMLPQIALSQLNQVNTATTQTPSNLPKWKTLTKILCQLRKTILQTNSTLTIAKEVITTNNKNSL